MYKGSTIVDIRSDIYDGDASVFEGGITTVLTQWCDQDVFTGADSGATTMSLRRLTVVLLLHRCQIKAALGVQVNSYFHFNHFILIYIAK